MLQFQLWKKLLVVMVAVLGIIFALPNLIGGDDGAGADFLPGKQINLGLDLQGGSHLLLRVDVDAVKQALSQVVAGFGSGEVFNVVPLRKIP